jgi:hypothetical protein
MSDSRRRYVGQYRLLASFMTWAILHTVRFEREFSKNAPSIYFAPAHVRNNANTVAIKHATRKVSNSNTLNFACFLCHLLARR